MQAEQKCLGLHKRLLWKHDKTWNLTQEICISSMKIESTFRKQTRRLCNSFFGGFTLHLQNACASHPSLETITSAEQHSMVYIFSSFCFPCSILFQSWKRRNIMPSLRTIKIEARDVILHSTTKEHHSTWFSPSSPGPTPFRQYSRKYFFFLSYIHKF